jgi:hypothetical protein
LVAGPLFFLKGGLGVCRLDWCGLCYENRRGRASHAGHRFRCAGVEREVTVMGLIRRNTASDVAGAPVGNPPWDPGSGLGQATWEFLTTVLWDVGGGKRETGTVLLFGDAGRLKVVLNDRDANLIAFVTVGPSAAVLDAIEEALLSTDTDWRAAKRPGAPRK